MLYIVSTPIGNLDDLSIRQAKTLFASDIILAEDTRSAKTLLNGIKERFPQLTINSRQSMISYFKNVEFDKLPEIIDLLKEGGNVSLISESGSPVISDPGYLLVKTVVREKIPFTVIPGPSALTASVVLSGFNPSPKDGGVMFLGFFPKKVSEKNRIIEKLKSVKAIFPDTVFVFYESSQRIVETLQCFLSADRQDKPLKWDPEIAVCREMTKKFEEVVRGKPGELSERDYKGELTVVVR